MELLLLPFMLLIAATPIIIHVILASRFSDYARKKGYNGTPYFWACLLLGITGYCMVAALPDLELHKRLQAKTLPNGNWLCIHCGTENSSNYGMCKKCGSNRA